MAEVNRTMRPMIKSKRCIYTKEKVQELMANRAAGKSIIDFASENPDTIGEPTFVPVTPQQIWQSYSMNVTPTTGAGKTIAVIEGGGVPNLASDMALYCSLFNLPPCTLQVVNQTGGATLPPYNSVWFLEAALDTQIAHAMAPAATIICVQCNSANGSDLLAGAQWASTHADYVSMSFSGPEDATTESDNAVFANAPPTTSFFASSGDGGNAAAFPASSPNVVAVGGTTLLTNSGDGSFAAELGWYYSSGGCSAVFTAPPSQIAYGYNPCLGMRAMPDVCMVANETYTFSQGSAYVLTGTSISAPLFAGRAAAEGIVVNVPYIYENTTINYRDITEGYSNLQPLPGVNIYNSCLFGPDLVTGIGSWNGDT